MENEMCIAHIHSSCKDSRLCVHLYSYMDIRHLINAPSSDVCSFISNKNTKPKESVFEEAINALCLYYLLL